MCKYLMLVPVGTDVGLTAVCMGTIRALQNRGMKVNFFKPISQDPNNADRATGILSADPNINPPEPVEYDFAEQCISSNDTDTLLERVIASANAAKDDSEVVIVEGLTTSRSHPFANSLNAKLARALDAQLLLVMQPGADSDSQLQHRLEVAINHFGGRDNPRLLGAIINKIGLPADHAQRLRPDLFEAQQIPAQKRSLNLLQQLNCPLPTLGGIPFNPELTAPRVSDLARHLNAQVVFAGEMHQRRLKHITFCAHSVPSVIDSLQPDTLMVTSGDREEIIITACLAVMNGLRIGALLLTGGIKLDPRVEDICQQAIATGLPILMTDSNTWQTAQEIRSLEHDIPGDDIERIEAIQSYIASHIPRSLVQQLSASSNRAHRLSPPAFRYQLTEKARRADKRIVLPEGEEPRTIKAAALCAERGIARCVLLGNPKVIARVAKLEGVNLGPGIEIIDPPAVQERYVMPMCELRRGKGLTEVVAREQLEDNVVLGTMMLAQNEVDGLVSGAVHTTANTIRPPLQLIKTAPGSSLVSSVFFMLLPDQVLVYGDCAINPAPSAEQLAEIAIQSADSALAFGIDPRVAMISYSTGSSGAGDDVEKVRLATQLVRHKRPDLIVDGPLQYDAAVMPNVAAAKAPDSSVAGQATVFVFPDLNTGNTTYKAVQRSAELISIGPMLQGMRKPVNDLSRGALVDDIVYTIALTAIQANQQ